MVRRANPPDGGPYVHLGRGLALPAPFGGGVMARTFCNTGFLLKKRHAVKAERGHYIMSGFWVDTASPRDMMDYDFTAPIHELKTLHEEIRLSNIRGAV